MTKAEAVNLFEGFNGRPPSDSELSKLDIIFRPHRDEPKLKSRIRKGTGDGAAGTGTNCSTTRMTATDAPSACQRHPSLPSRKRKKHWMRS